MKRNTNCIFLLLLTVVLVIGLWSTVAFASSPTSVDPSETLDVYIKTALGTILLHTYEESEMSDLADGSNVKYSSIDSGGFTVKTIATGVYVKDLLDDVMKNYTDINVWDFEYLKFVATDGASGKFDYDELFSTDRYYYPNLEKYGLNEDGEIDYDPGNSMLVKPMLAMKAKQQRLPEDDGRDVYYPEEYTILFGMSKDELENVEARTSDFKRGVCTLTINMGSYTAPTTDAVTGITLDQTEATFAVGKKLQLTATILPSNTTNKNVTWTTSDATVATVSSDGMVSGVAAGRATITATSVRDSTKSATCTITVSQISSTQSGENIDVTGIVLSKNQLTLAVSGKKTLTATVSPSSATDSTVNWKSSDTSIATVDKNGVVKGVKVGVAKISATAGRYSATCMVTVTNTVIAVKGVTLNNTATTMSKGKSYRITAIISPDTATNTTVLWSSDAPGIVSIDTNGLMTAKNIGSAVISVMTEDGSFTAQCKVTVRNTASSFSDVSNSWAKDNIESMINLGLISGYSDGTFKPNATITRAEFLSILIRVLEKTQNVKLQTGNTFNDTANHWANDYISTAIALKITNGYEDGTFGPNDNITREQIAVMLAKAANYDANQTSVSFTDNQLISAWAVSAVDYTVNEKLFTGYKDGSFGPKKNATRAEVSALLLRFYEKLNIK